MFDPQKAVKAIHKRFRSAKSGKFVSKLFALLHPSTTVSETLRDEGDSL